MNTAVEAPCTARLAGDLRPMWTCCCRLSTARLSSSPKQFAFFFSTLLCGFMIMVHYQGSSRRFNVGPERKREREKNRKQNIKTDFYFFFIIQQRICAHNMCRSSLNTVNNLAMKCYYWYIFFYNFVHCKFVLCSGMTLLLVRNNDKFLCFGDLLSTGFFCFFIFVFLHCDIWSFFVIVNLQRGVGGERTEWGVWSHATQAVIFSLGL